VPSAVICGVLIKISLSPLILITKDLNAMIRFLSLLQLNYFAITFHVHASVQLHSDCWENFTFMTNRQLLVTINILRFFYIATKKHTKEKVSLCET